MPNIRLLYFSIIKQRSESFWNNVRKPDNSFRPVDYGKELEIASASDLLYILQKERKNLRGMYVIIDYISMCQSITDIEKNSKFIRDAIIQYPEVVFVFDESHEKSQSYDYKVFLFMGQDIAVTIYDEFHKYNANQENPFKAITYGFDNLYDASNLRCAVKSFSYDKLKVRKRNFRKVQESRRDNLAVCVEEESSQNRFNSYAMYANGMRVLPVMTAHMLDDANELKFGKPKIVLRDYDLQFPDADTEKYQELAAKICNRESNQLVDCIRGAKFNEETKKWNVLVDYKNENGKNSFWNQIADKESKSLFFISKGRDNLEIHPGEQEYCYYETRDDDPSFLHVSGLMKPITGLYEPFHSLASTKTYDNTRIKRDEKHEKKHKKDNEQLYEIITDRENHNHGVPLDLYDMVRDMISRARDYYDNCKYIHAALISNEAIEVMNGFHQSLMIKAYHLNAISENAIAMNVMGGDEKWLTLDSVFRIKKIHEDVDRLLYGTSGNRIQQSLTNNVLNQIYSDCRAFCKEKEHFDAEDCFVSAMGHLNEHYTVNEIWKDIKNDYKIVSSSVKEHCKVFLKKLREKEIEEETQKAENTESN